MDIEEIKEALAQLEISQLKTLETSITQLIQKAGDTASLTDGDGGQDQRAEQRVATEIHTSIRRITDIQAYEKTEYAGLIRDISRSGLCIQVPATFIPSRVIEATFQTPAGKTKRTLLEVVRMRKVGEGQRRTLQLGCRGVAPEVVEEMRAQEQRVAEIKRRLEKRDAITIVVISSDVDAGASVTERLQGEGYNASAAPNVMATLEAPRPSESALAIVLNSSQVCQNEDELKALGQVPSQWARLVVIEDEADRPVLLKLGVDECVSAERRDELLLHSVDRALVGHATRQNKRADSEAARVVVISSRRSASNMLGYHLDQHSVPWKAVDCAEEVAQEELDGCELVIMDFDPKKPEQFTQLCQGSEQVPVVALCDQIADGNEAMACMATDYLCLPLHGEQVTVMLQSLVPALVGTSE